MAALASITIGDTEQSWRDAWFDVEAGWCRIGDISIELVGVAGPRGIRSIGLHGIERDRGEIDGLPFHRAEPGVEIGAGDHSNGATVIDHLVVMTPDCDRTTDALQANDIELRRVRTFDIDGSTRRQSFFWLGATILELVGDDTAHGAGPAVPWGLAISVADIDTTCAALGPAISEPRVAVQTGRRIATLRHRDLGISVPIAFMTPHLDSGV